MRFLHKKIIFIFAMFLSQFISSDLSKLNVPEGFEISVFNAEINNPRQMVEGADYIFVGSRSAGNVYAIKKDNSTESLVLLEDLNAPSGVALHEGNLYIAEVDKILVIKNIEQRMELGTGLVAEIFFDALPRKDMWNPMRKGWHGWKWIDFGPDGNLYIAEGVPCNVCDEDDERFGTILKLSDNNLSIYADGVRNSVGFDWHPTSGEMYFTDNGRDWMGDDIPPCELNRVQYEGEHFGFPYVHGSDVKDDGFKLPEGFEFSKPVWNFQAHTAPIGMKFYDGTMFPDRYKNGIFVAQHGSWNRPAGKVGYRVLFMKTNNGLVESSEVFIDGWLEGEISWGAPAAPLVLKDGSMLISDDRSNQIFKVTYKNTKN